MLILPPREIRIRIIGCGEMAVQTFEFDITDLPNSTYQPFDLLGFYTETRHTGVDLQMRSEFTSRDIWGDGFELIAGIDCRCEIFLYEKRCRFWSEIVKHQNR